MSELKLCADCGKIKTSNPHKEKQGETQCVTCSNKMHFDKIQKQEIIVLNIDATVVPKWYIEKIKSDIEEFKKLSKN